MQTEISPGNIEDTIWASWRIVGHYAQQNRPKLCVVYIDALESGIYNVCREQAMAAFTALSRGHVLRVISNIITCSTSVQRTKNSDKVIETSPQAEE